MEKETITGFNIEKRKLTQEEMNREITLDRFDEFHVKAGEDFCDTVGHLINSKILCGFLIAKQPQISHQLLNEINQDGDALSLLHIYEDLLVEGDDEFYSDLAEFANLTTHLKARLNQILIQVAEHYRD
jgi:hypothetical protein